MAGRLVSAFDARPNSKQRNMQFDGAPLVERNLTLVNRFGEQRSLRGLVPLGIDKVEEVQFILSQNGGTCNIEKGTGDLSEFTWIKSIALSDGFTVADWLQIRNRSMEFEIGRLKDGRSFWENANTLKVKEAGATVITEDYGMTAELPDTSDILNGKKACGGCGGDMSKDSLEAARIAIRYGWDRDEFSVNPDTGEVKEQAKYADGLAISIDVTQIIPGPNNPIVQDVYTKSNETGGFGNGLLVKLLLSSQSSEESFRNQPVILTSPIPVTQTDVPKPEKQMCEQYTPEESMILRLLMNPTERKLWGRLYGLPDDEASPIVLEKLVLQSLQTIRAPTPLSVQHQKQLPTKSQDEDKPVQQPKLPRLVFSSIKIDTESKPQEVSSKQKHPVQVSTQQHFQKPKSPGIKQKPVRTKTPKKKPVSELESTRTNKKRHEIRDAEPTGKIPKSRKAPKPVSLDEVKDETKKPKRRKSTKKTSDELESTKKLSDEKKKAKKRKHPEPEIEGIQKKEKKARRIKKQLESPEPLKKQKTKRINDQMEQDEKTRKKSKIHHPAASKRKSNNPKNHTLAKKKRRKKRVSRYYLLDMLGVINKRKKSNGKVVVRN
ncbi:MAG: hypothetical protein ABH842_00785 [Candidatus Micrarchaeota archaeon]